MRSYYSGNSDCKDHVSNTRTIDFAKAPAKDSSGCCASGVVFIQRIKCVSFLLFPSYNLPHRVMERRASEDLARSMWRRNLPSEAALEDAAHVEEKRSRQDRYSTAYINRVGPSYTATIKLSSAVVHSITVHPIIICFSWLKHCCIGHCW